MLDKEEPQGKLLPQGDGRPKERHPTGWNVGSAEWAVSEIRSSG